MIAFIKKFWKWIVIGAALAVFAGIGLDAVKAMLWNAALNAAKIEHEAEIAKRDKAIAAGKAALAVLAETSGKDRETMRDKAAAEKRRLENVLAILKSEAAAELRRRKAKLEEVLAEKEKDEIVIQEQGETIDVLFEINYATLYLWARSDENLLAGHAQVTADLEAKYSACAEWSAKLEAEIRPSFWKKLKDAGKYALGFSGGYLVGRGMK